LGGDLTFIRPAVHIPAILYPLSTISLHLYPTNNTFRVACPQCEPFRLCRRVRFIVVSIVKTIRDGTDEKGTHRKRDMSYKGRLITLFENTSVEGCTYGSLS
jgi:hypothetical protein